MNSTVIRAAFVALLVAVAPRGAQVAADDAPPPSIDRLVIFGDSLSDPGNAFVATREFVVRPFDPIPDAPYLIGRFHFTNGLTWVEQLARDLDLGRSARPALLRPGVYTNYAVGAARARQVGPLNLSAQVDLFLADFDGVAAPETLYVLWIGATDLRDAFEALAVQMDPDRAARIILEALAATDENIRKLYGAGARSFLVFNLPNIGDTPAVRILGPEARQAARTISEQYNSALEAALMGLEDDPGLSEIALTRLDVFAILDEAVDDPESAGLTNVTDSCIRPGVIVGAICHQPRRYLFWDFIHPTERAHEYLGEQAKARLDMEFLIAAF